MSTDLEIWSDLGEVVNDLVHTGRSWCGLLPPEYHDPSTPGRIRGAAFSFLVTIDGDGGPGPLRLSPIDHPDVDLGGQALHEMFGSSTLVGLDDHHQRFMGHVHRLVNTHTTTPGHVVDVMGRFLQHLCDLLAEHYQLRIISTDWETGEYLDARDDLAPLLPEAFARAWAQP